MDLLPHSQFPYSYRTLILLYNKSLQSNSLTPAVLLFNASVYCHITVNLSTIPNHQPNSHPWIFSTRLAYHSLCVSKPCVRVKSRNFAYRSTTSKRHTNCSFRKQTGHRFPFALVCLHRTPIISSLVHRYRVVQIYELTVYSNIIVNLSTIQSNINPTLSPESSQPALHTTHSDFPSHAFA